MANMSAAGRVVRGGQTTQHWFRMAAQVFGTTLMAGTAVYTLSIAVLIWFYYELFEMRLVIAEFTARVFHLPFGRMDAIITLVNADGFPEQISIGEFLNDATIRDQIKAITAKYSWFLWVSCLPALLAGGICAWVYTRSGQKLGIPEHQRGALLVQQDALKHWSEQKWKTYIKRFGKDAGGPPYTLAGVKFPPGAVQAQTGFVGTVGGGKTTALIELLLTVRNEDGRAIVYDRMGTLVEKFYNPARGDKIINPFDKRSVAWSPFYEATDIASFSQMAEVLIPTNADHPDPFWQISARLVFEFAAKRLLDRGDGNNRSMREAISIISDEELIELVAQTPAAALLSEKSPKTAQGIRANLIAELRFFEFLRDDAERFSIRDWVKNDDPGFIFLTGDSEHGAATRNVISACLEISANALMTCGQSRVPKLWFMVDELPTLNKLPFIEKSLAEIRQFGGAFVIGYQVYAQLEQIYGDKGARSISGVLNNRLIFNTPDAVTAKFLSESLGQEDVVDQRQTITMGAHSTRDGAGFNEQRVERAIVTASEIQCLPTLTAFLRFAYDAPASKVRFDYISMPDRADAYIPYEGDGFAYGSLEQDAETPKARPKVAPVCVVNPKEAFDKNEALYLFEEWKFGLYQKTINMNDILHNREPAVPNKKFLRFEPDKYEFWQDAYADDRYTQKLLWEHFFMSVAKGAEKDKIDDLRSENVYTSKEYKPLLQIVPPFPFPPSTDGPDEPVKETIEAREPKKDCIDDLDTFIASYSSTSAEALFDD